MVIQVVAEETGPSQESYERVHRISPLPPEAEARIELRELHTVGDDRGDEIAPVEERAPAWSA
jgi:hypothetical protein